MVELNSSVLEILNPSKPLPFSLDEHTSVGEENPAEISLLRFEKRRNAKKS